MTGVSIRRALRRQDGAVQIVEASFVFPIMFIVLFFLIYMGNAFYIKGQVEAVVSTQALHGASYAVDPVLKSIRETHSVPAVDKVKIEPYRYIVGGMNEVEDEIAKEVRKELKTDSTTFFTTMKPKLSGTDEIAKYNSSVVYATFSVQVHYSLTFPIRYLGESSPTILKLSSRSEVPVNDAPEFIRNSDMAVDLLKDTKLGKTISDMFSKVSGFIEKLGGPN